MATTTRRLLLLLLLLLPLSVLGVLSRAHALRELGLSASKRHSEKDLKNAFRRRSLETHPDKGGSDDAFIKVAQAYEFLTTAKGGNGGGGSGGESRHSSHTTQNTQTTREQMEWAEDMFFDLFDEMNAGSAADNFIEAMFSSTKSNWITGPLKSIVKMAARQVVKLVAAALESEHSTINVNGRTFKGSDFKDMRERAKSRRTKRQRERIKAENKRRKNSDL